MFLKKERFLKMENIKEISTTYEEIINNIDKYIELFLSDGILAFRELNATEQQQRTILACFGDKLGWYPNKKYPKTHRYFEKHDNALTVYSNRGKDELIVLWHLEHCSVKHPQCGAAWNMLKFDCDPSTGTTGFISAAEIYEDMPEEWKIFLEKCVIRDHMHGKDAEDFEETGRFKSLDGYTYTSSPRNAVMKHPNRDLKICRINPIQVPADLISVDGEKPTNDDLDLFDQIWSYYRGEIWNNDDRAIWWSWRKGDLLIPDLRIMIHAVRGGFNYSERQFVGYWAYPNDAHESFADLRLQPEERNYILI